MTRAAVEDRITSVFSKADLSALLRKVRNRANRYGVLAKLHCRKTDQLVLELGSNEPDHAIARDLRRRFRGVPIHAGAAVLSLPKDPTAYARGRARQALRTNRGHANALGLRVRCLRRDEFAARAKQVRASRHVLAHFQQLEDAVLAPHDEIWAGETSTGHIIAFARLMVGSECALIKYFVATQDHTLSVIRWKMAADIFEALAQRGIRHVVAGSILDVSSGLGYYQDRLGFVPRKIVLTAQATPHTAYATSLVKRAA